MTEQPRDWDKELADIDRGHRQAGHPAARWRAPGPRRRAGTPRHSASGCRRRAGDRARSVALTWFWVRAGGAARGRPCRSGPTRRPAGCSSFFYLGAAAARAVLAGATGRRRAAGALDGVCAHLIAAARRRPRPVVMACARGAAADRLRGPGGDLAVPLERRRPRRRLHLRPHPDDGNIPHTPSWPRPSRTSSAASGSRPRPAPTSRTATPPTPAT